MLSRFGRKKAKRRSIPPSGGSSLVPAGGRPKVPWLGGDEITEPPRGSSSDQPMPTPGREDVPPEARRWFQEVFDRQVESGKRHYGTVLQTHNGRDALTDLAQELADAWAYLTQARLEWQDREEDVRAQLDALLSSYPNVGCWELRGLLGRVVVSLFNNDGWLIGSSKAHESISVCVDELKILLEHLDS